ncbi:MAG: Ig-like domain-containing protein, partial [Clostridia bacterium]|nr:Ig-like domain-containing protein [Clostridia bacterium]
MKLSSKWRVALATLVLAALFLLCGAARADGLTVHFLDIDRNDGILIQCDGEAAFIDAGTYNFGAQAVDYMQAAGVSRLKYYIGTHAHRDHVGGACKIILAMNPGLVLQPHDGVQSLIAQNARTQEEIAAVRAASYLSVTPGQTFSVGGARLTVLGPLSVTKYKNYTSLENGNSLVCRLTYGSTTILLTGDATAAELYEIEGANPGALKCDLLKNPHHNGALKANLLAACAPQYVVYSTSDRYLPTQTSLRDVAGLGARALITAHNQNGTVVFHSSGRGLSYTVSNGPAGVSLNKSAVTLYEGRQQTIAARLSPSSFRAVTYVSQNPAVATVDGAGRITGVAPGETTVRALTSNGLWDECAVTVLPTGVKLNQTALTLRAGATASLRAS